jgi:hypothetical protein
VHKNARGKKENDTRACRAGTVFPLCLFIKTQKTKTSVVPTLDGSQLANNITAAKKYFTSRVRIKSGVWLLSVVSFFMHCVVKSKLQRDKHVRIIKNAMRPSSFFILTR